MERQILDPIHLPCPDMAGCANPNPVLTEKSRQWVRNLRQKFADKFPKKDKAIIPERFLVACTVDEVKALGHAVEFKETTALGQPISFEQFNQKIAG